MGCDDSVVLKISRAFESLPSENDDVLSLNFQCISPFDSSTSIVEQISSFSYEFDIIIINQVLLKLNFENLRSCFGAAMGRIVNQADADADADARGSVLINGMLPERSPHPEETLDPFQLLMHMRSYAACDAALGLFEGGLLLVIPRQNPYGFSAEVLQSAKYDYFKYRYDISDADPNYFCLFWPCICAVSDRYRFA